MQEQRINKYNKYVVTEDLLLASNYNSVMEFPSFVRAVMNTSSKEYLTERRQSVNGLAACFLLSGQKSISTRARKSIAGFKLREGALIGCRATLRKRKLYTIIDKLLVFVLPRLYSEKRNAANLERASLLFLKRGLKDSISFSSKSLARSPLQTRQSEVTATNKTVFFSGKGTCNLDQTHTQTTKILSQEERYQLLMHLSFFKEGNNKKTTPNQGTSNKGRLYHFFLSIKDLLLMPELQEFLPLFESVRGLNIGISFSNPRIKGALLPATFFSAKQNFPTQYLAPHLLQERKVLNNSTNALLWAYPSGDKQEGGEQHNLVKERDGVVLVLSYAEQVAEQERKGVFELNQIEDFAFTYNTVKRKETKESANASVFSLREHKRSARLFEGMGNQATIKPTFTQKQNIEKDNTLNIFYKPKDTSHSKGNRKIFFLTCFQYPSQYN